MRQSGVLMHMTSLPSPGGVGTLGKEAYAFADFMEKAGLRVWQMLPIGPTGYGESPYQSGSTHAGNPMLIDLELLREEGLLDAELPDPASDPDRVDFPNVRARKEALLRLSFQQSFARVEEDVREFSARQAWSPDGRKKRQLAGHLRPLRRHQGCLRRGYVDEVAETISGRAARGRRAL